MYVNKMRFNIGQCFDWKYQLKYSTYIKTEKLQEWLQMHIKEEIDSAWINHKSYLDRISHA